jgi:hypothetical protein
MASNECGVIYTLTIVHIFDENYVFVCFTYCGRNFRGILTTSQLGYKRKTFETGGIWNLREREAFPGKYEMNG